MKAFTAIVTLCLCILFLWGANSIASLLLRTDADTEHLHDGFLTETLPGISLLKNALPPPQETASAHASLRMTEHDTLPTAMPEDADIRTEASETETAWLQENISRFPGLPMERVLQNPGLVHFLYRYGTGDYETGRDIVLTQNEQGGDIPLFLQWDARWGYDAYGDSVIGLAGCAPCALSMVIVGLTGNETATPRAIADFSVQNDHYLSGTGTRWSLLRDAASAWGLSCRDMETDHASVVKELKKGRPVILNVGPGHFTTTGHFLVAYGRSKDGLLMHDPNSLKNSAQVWDYNDIAEEVRAAWVFDTK